MRTSQWTNVVGAVAILVSAAMFVDRAWTQESDARLASIIRDWSQRFQPVRSVKYVIEGNHILPKGTITQDEYGERLPEPQPAQDVVTPLRRTLILDLASNRFRLEVDDVGWSRGHGRYAIKRTDVYTGSEYRILNPRDPNPDADYGNVLVPDFAITTGDAANRHFELPHWPMLEGLGIIQGLIFLERSTAKQIITTPDSDLLTLYGEGVHNGRRCTIVRTHSRGGKGGVFEEYWVDAERQSAVVKHLLIGQKVPLEEFVIDCQRHSRGWYPSAWTYTRRDRAGKVTEVEKVRVAELVFDFEPREEDFALLPGAGAVIAETRFTGAGPGAGAHGPQVEDQHFYRIGADGSRQEIDKLTGEALPHPGWYWGLGLGVLLAVASVLSYIALRRRPWNGRASNQTST